jgi:hypothetical protein
MTGADLVVVVVWQYLINRALAGLMLVLVLVVLRAGGTAVCWWYILRAGGTACWWYCVVLTEHDNQVPNQTLVHVNVHVGFEQCDLCPLRMVYIEMIRRIWFHMHL